MAAGELSKLGAWVAGLSFEQIPSEVLRAARAQVLNMLAAARAASEVPAARATAAAIASTCGRGRCSVVTTGEPLPVVEAAMVNAAFSMAQDFDDIVWMGHTGHSAVFASLAVAQQEGRSSRDFLTAVVAANEVAGRLGASCFLGPLNGQMWTFIHLVGAAAATAKLLGLDEAKTTNALAVALSQPTFPLQPAFLGTSSKLLAASTPTATGIQAGYLARSGLTAPATILEDVGGFWSRFSFLPLREMLGELGRFWCLESLTVKTFPGCHYFQTACTALSRLLARRPMELDDVERIEVETTKLGLEVTRFAGRHATGDRIDPVNLSFDLATTAAVLLHAKRFTSREATPDFLDASSSEILRWREKIHVRHSPELTSQVLASARAIPMGRQALSSLGVKQLLSLRRAYAREYRATLISADEVAGWGRALAKRLLGRAPAPAGRGVPLRFPNRVTMHLRGGITEMEQVDLPVGSLASPDFDAELRAKYLREVSRALTPERAARTYEAGLTLDAQPLTELF